MSFLRRHSQVLAWITAVATAAVLAACGGGGGGNDAATGTLGVSLTDSPACGFDAVNVTVSKVRVNQSGSVGDTDYGWTDIALNPARKINLLSLSNGVLMSLGETPLDAGHYTQLRLVLDPNTTGGMANSVVPTGGVETPLITPSAVQSGIKLIHQFDVSAGQRVDLVLDFDACKSVVKRGNGTYSLKPVISVVPTALNGIDGFVDTALLGSNVSVTAQQNGTIVQTTVPNTTTGEFLLARLAAGNYDVAITADGHATAVIGAVPVATSTSVVNISTMTAPISLPLSATHKISGTETLNPATSTAVAYAAAMQTIGAAPSVTVKFVAADDGSSPPGAYSLTLPVAAPLFGQYSATLPLILSAQAAQAGKYVLRASAEGYQTQSSTVTDISAADATLHFVLVP